MRVGVAVEDVGARELPRGDDDPPRGAGAAELVLLVFLPLRFAAERERLPQEHAGEVRLQLRAVYPVGLAVGRSRETEDAAKALAGDRLDVYVRLASGPEPPPDEERCGERAARLLPALKAVLSLVGRVERPVPLQLPRRLAVY